MEIVEFLKRSKCNETKENITMFSRSKRYAKMDDITEGIVNVAKYFEQYIPRTIGENKQLFIYRLCFLFADYTWNKNLNEVDGSLGKSMKIFISKNIDRKDSFSRRFEDLLSVDNEVFWDKLCSILTLMKKDDIPINWNNLFGDCLWWGDKTREKWARDCWSIQQ